MKKSLGAILACLVTVASFGQHSVLEVSGVAGFDMPCGNLLVLEDIFGAVLWRGSSPTASDYVQDGLVAIWDGIENAGWGVHDPNATYVSDLIASRRKPATVEDAYFESKSGTYFNMFSGETNVTLDVCAPFSQFGNQIFVSSTNNTSAANMSFRITGTSLSYGNVNTTYLATGGLQNWYPFSKNGTTSVAMQASANDGVFRVWRNGAYFNRKTGTPVGVRYLHIGGGSANYSRIYCIRVYNRLLTSDEIAWNYAIDRERFGL